LIDGVIRFQKRIWIGHNTALQTKLISSFHASALGGHSGMQATYQMLKKLFYWQGVKLDVESFVKQCLVCQRAKHELCKYPGLLQPLRVPQHSWTDISMDFIECLPISHGYSVILVVVDRFTKYSHFFPMKHPYTSTSVAQLFLDNIVKLPGVPSRIVSDKDRVFTSSFWTELFKLLKTELKIGSTYHPQMDGQIEHVNQCLEMFLRCSVQETPNTWVKWLLLAELWFNTSFHASLKCSPFKALYALGFFPSLRLADHPDIVEIVKERQLFTELLKGNLAKAQNRMKVQAENNRTDHSFQIGDRVLLKLQPYAQGSVVHRPFPKLAYKFFGPF
jgi:hypothetical protein